MTDTITVPDGERVTYKTRGESLQTANALEMAHDRIAQLERQIKQRDDTIEQLRANNHSFAADTLAMATVHGIVFGTDAHAQSNDELYRAIRELQAKAATLDRLGTAFVEREACFSVMGPSKKLAYVYGGYFVYEADKHLLTTERVESFTAALDALLGEVQS